VATNTWTAWGCAPMTTRRVPKSTCSCAPDGVSKRTVARAAAFNRLRNSRTARSTVRRPVAQLTAILSNAQAAQLLTAEPKFNVEELREILQDIVSDDKRAGQIIARMRSLLMRGEIQIQGVEIGELLRNILALAHSMIQERNVQVDSAAYLLRSRAHGVELL
jgi:C4-dicarboxylate-specific signal transduction histidine kinase